MDSSHFSTNQKFNYSLLTYFEREMGKHSHILIIYTPRLCICFTIILQLTVSACLAAIVHRDIEGYKIMSQLGLEVR